MQIPLPARRTVIIRRRDTQGRQGRIETGRGVCALPPRYITKPSIPRACLARFIRELHYFFFAFFFFFFSFFSFLFVSTSFNAIPRGHRRFSVAARFRESIGKNATSAERNYLEKETGFSRSISPDSLS